MARPALHVAPAGTHLPAEVTDLLASWAPGRRWYPAGVSGRPIPWQEVTVEDAPNVVLALLRAGDEATIVQVPLVVFGKGDARGSARADGAQRAYIGSAGGLDVYDGGQHPEAWAALLAAAGLPDADLTDARVLAGEQSNTSVILPHTITEAAPAGAIMKILRTITDGPHPDVTVPQALTGVGFTGTPLFLGAVEVSLAPVGPPEAHLAMVAALVPEAHDGFELACQYAGRGESFAELAATLGATIAELHAALRRALPVNEALNVTDFCCLLRRRAIAAIDIAFEALVPHEAAILDVYDNLEHVLNSASKPARLQHIHGDLHLGQTLLGADGWQVLDFEGEPQRPVAERTQPDLPLRDVAGMLRSFDYAAVVGDCPDPAWVGEAQAAFLAAYRQASDMPNDHMSSAILNALVLDKSLYEVVYETRQRPHWVHIPLAAVEQILVGSRKVVP